MERMRARWLDMLTGGPEVDSTDVHYSQWANRIAMTALDHQLAMDRSPDRTTLWHDLAGSSDGRHIMLNYLRIRDMALAFKAKGSPSENDARLQSDILAAWDWMRERQYAEGMKMRGNWYYWEIGAPKAMADIAVLMYNHLSTEQIHHFGRTIDWFNPTAAGPTYEYWAANKVWRCTVIAVRGAVCGQADKLSQARDELSPVFDYVTHSDGFYKDGSFIQHERYAYTGGYGLGLLTDTARLLIFLHGSDWEVTDPGHRHVFRWIYDSYEPLMADGAMMDMVRGREVSRETRQDRDAGRACLSAIMGLSDIAPAADAAAFKAMAKHWLLQDKSLLQVPDQATPNSALQMRSLLDDETVQPRAAYSKCKLFPAMDRAVHHRPHYAYGISMFSERNATYESCHHENTRGWYSSHGMTYLYNKDLSQFSDHFWATVDPYRLPGTTVDKAAREKEFGEGFWGARSFIGGASLEEKYGAVAMELEDYKMTFSNLMYRFDAPAREVADEAVLEFTLTPLFTREDKANNAIIGFADADTGITGLKHASLLLRLNQQDCFDVRNGDDYEAMVRVGYEANRAYRVKIAANLKREEYDVWVTDDEGNEHQLASQFRFRTGAPAVRRLGQLFVWRSNVRKVQLQLERMQLGGQPLPLHPIEEESMTARKSWFLFDDAIVAVGSGISAPEGRRVETVIENRKLSAAADETLTVNGLAKPAVAGWSETMQGTNWMHLASPSDLNGIGYCFPSETQVHALRETRVGRWSDINGTSGRHDDITRSYLTLWFDHGQGPRHGQYAYVLLPGMSAAQVGQYAAHPSVEIIEQSDEAHAVAEHKLGLTAVHFWSDAPKTVAGISSSGRASVILQAAEGKLDVAIADPTQRNERWLTIGLPYSAAEVLQADPAITVVQLNPMIVLEVLVKDARGRSIAASFKR